MLFEFLNSRLRILLPLAVSLLACSCTRSNAQEGITRVWAVDDGEKVLQNDVNHWAATSASNTVWDGSSVRLFAARNEIVSFQLILESGSLGANRVYVELDSLISPAGVITNVGGIGDPFNYVGKRIELFVTQYLNVPTRSSWDGAWGWMSARSLPDDQYVGWIPDALVPFEAPAGDRSNGQGGAPFRILPGTSQSVWVDITVPRTQEPGMYVGTIVVSENGFIRRRIPVFLRVYGFTLPDETHARNFFHYGSALIELHPEVKAGSLDRNVIVERYMNHAHRHRVNLVDGFRTVDDFANNFGKYFTGAQYTAQNGYEGPGEGVGETMYSIGTYDQPNHGFLSGFDPPTREVWQTSSDRWEQWFLDNAPSVIRFKYMIDEPQVEQHPTIKERASWIREGTGAGKNIGIFCATRLHPDLYGSINVWAVGGQTGYSVDGVGNGFDLPRAAERQGLGEIVGIYNGCRPSFGQASALDAPATDNRVNPWIMWKYNVDFYFLFDVAAYAYTRVNPWENQKSMIYNSVLWGDGFWIYPGGNIYHPQDDRNLAGPISSVRMKNWRRGAQDYEYLWLARQAGIDSRSIVDRVVPRAFNDYGGSYTSQGSQPLWGQHGYTFEEARAELARLIASGGSPSTLPPVAGLHASPAALPPAGGEVVLTWTVEDAPEGTLDNDLGTVGPKGSQTVTVTKTTTFVLTVSTPTGTARATATVQVGPPAPSSGANILSNPDFDGGVEGWTFESEGGAQFGHGVPGFQSFGAARVAITGAQSFVRLSQSGLKMFRNSTYRLKFAARSSLGLDVEASVARQGAPGTAYGLSPRAFDLTPDWKVYSVDFTSANIADSVADASLVLDLSASAAPDAEYLFDDIILSKTGANAQPLPKDYALEQNFPNPFNPVTTIEFALPAGARTTLKIFNMLGQEVATLVNEFLAQGIHRAEFDASRLPTGLYAYRLQAGDFVQTRKMLLVK